LVKPAEESQKENEMTSKSELVLGKEHWAAMHFSLIQEA
jgi:hypothetical protein